MARAYQTGVYSLREIADYFGVHYATVSRMETGRGSVVRAPPRVLRRFDCKT